MTWFSWVISKKCALLPSFSWKGKFLLIYSVRVFINFLKSQYWKNPLGAENFAPSHLIVSKSNRIVFFLENI